MIARWARVEATAIVLLGGGVTLVAALWLGWWGLLPAVVSAALLGFYRDPPRRIPRGDDQLLAPADGTVLQALDRVELPDEDGPVLRVVIFLSVLNVHVNRSPCAGEVTAVEYAPGAFHNALGGAATDANERNTLTLAPRSLPGPIRVRQIAGLLARRIVCAAAVGDFLAAGQRFGMIKLGSQTELRAPADGGWELCVQPGSRVRAGVTVLARRTGS